MNSIHRRRKGFTLLEILLVIAAIGILAAILLIAINPNKQIEAARSAKRKTDINTISKAIQQYSIDNNGQYPTGIDVGAKAICQNSNPVGCIDLNVLAPTYIASVPQSDSNYYYVRKNIAGTSIEVSHPRDSVWETGGIPSLDLNFAKNKSLIDGVSGKNLIDFTRASTGTYVGEDGLIKTAAVNEPRFDHNPTTGESLGLLVEEQRTNSIRNNTMVGAVAGTPGTLPTNWVAATSQTGLSREIVSIGTEDGINYIDIRYSGTATATDAIAILTDGATAIAASTGQTWTGSVYARIVNGSTSGITATSTRIRERTDAGTVLASTTASLGNPSNLRNGRVATTRTLTDATTARISQDVIFSYTNGAAIDITLRIGLPQLEQGAFATSVIPTTTASATRSADVASITGTNFSSWYRQDEGVIVINYATYQTSSSFFPATVSFSDGTNSNRIQLSHSAGARRIAVSAGGVSQWEAAGNVLGSPAFGVFARQALGYRASDWAGCVNGGSLAIHSSGSVPSVTRLNLGADGAGATPLNGLISRLTYWPTRVSNANLQKLTQ